MAYAYVNGDGSIDTSRSTLPKRMVSRTGTGRYCFHGDTLTNLALPTVRNVMVTVDQQSILNQGQQIFFIGDLVASATIGGCGAVEVDIARQDGADTTYVDRGFFVLFN